MRGLSSAVNFCSSTTLLPVNSASSEHADARCCQQASISTGHWECRCCQTVSPLPSQPNSNEALPCQFSHGVECEALNHSQLSARMPFEQKGVQPYTPLLLQPDNASQPSYHTSSLHTAPAETHRILIGMLPHQRIHPQQDLDCRPTHCNNTQHFACKSPHSAAKKRLHLIALT